jgi:cytochrome c-type biogenesis protein CcmH/NrfG
MTERGGGGRDRTRWSATTRPVQRLVTDLREVLRDDQTRWWMLGPDTVVSNDASGAASGPTSGRC